MNLSFFIARRYLFSTRKKSFINIISILSVVGVAFTTAALIIVLSVFNGLEELLESLNNSFDPQIKIEAAEGKSFLRSDYLIDSIAVVPGVDIITEVIEDYAYVRYRDADQVVTIKGVSDNFIQQNRIPKSNIVEGEFKLHEGNTPYAVIGRGVQYTLSIAANDPMFPLQVYYIKDVRSASLDPSKLYTKRNILPAGVFSIVQNFDENYVIVPLDFAQELLNYGNKRTALEIKVRSNFSISEVEAAIQKRIGKAYKVLNSQEQHQDIYRLLKMEKLFSFIALTLLLFIGSINIFFSLMMLALDKKKDISILSSMGASEKHIRNVFLAEGSLIACIGAILGLTLGGIFCWIQMKYGIISLGMETAITEGYPVKVKLMDFIQTLIVVSLITMVISIHPARIASRFAAPNQL